MLGLRRHSFAALDSCSLLRPRYWCFPTAPFTHELMMFAYDQSTGKHFPYISVWKHFSDVSYIFAKLSVCFVPAYLSNWSSSVPFFIFGRSERTGSEKKFVLYFFFLQMRHSIWWSLQKQQSERKFLKCIRSIFADSTVQKRRQTILPPTSFVTTKIQQTLDTISFYAC